MDTEPSLGAVLAPYALVRLAALPCPPAPPATLPFREVMTSLAGKEAEVIAVARELVERLHDSSGTHSAVFHQNVVLPLRRDVHNGRMPRPALLAALDTLPDRIPLLAKWLALRSDLDRAAGEVTRLWEPALVAERLVLADLCAAEPVRRAATLTGRDLLHGMDRTAAGGGAPDRRARKAEPTLLRFALRAVSKTSPLSWYTSVGWGEWAPATSIGGEPVAYTRVNHALLARLSAALLTDPVRRTEVPHRLAPATHERDGRVYFRRDIPDAGATRAYVGREEVVDLPMTGPLRFVIDTVNAASPKGISPAELAGELGARLQDGRAGQAARYLDRLLDMGLLVAVSPVDPQDPDGAVALSVWLHERGEFELADLLSELHCRTRDFATLPAGARPAELTGLEDSWKALGERTGAELAGVQPLREDVVLPGPIALGADLGRDAGATLARLMPLLMLFDRQLLIRRVLRDLFVERFGAGGVARPADCAELVKPALIAGVTATRGGHGPEIDALLAARATLTGMIRPDGAVGDLEIPDAAVDAAAALLPQWMASRPVSYSLFVQPLPDGGLVVNQIYAGFGLFPGRFLEWFPASAGASVTGMLGKAFGERGFLQFRPVCGFNANLHPMHTDREIGEDPRWADLGPDQLDLYHDRERDEIRLRHKGSGERVDVLYLGYLMSVSLPERMAALYTDLACGWVHVADLMSTVDSAGVVATGQLRYRDVVLSRRCWEFDAGALRAVFAGDEVDRAVAAARLRAAHDIVRTGGQVTSKAEFDARLGAAKPQYVDLSNALHLRCLPRLLSRYDGRILLTEALPVPEGQVVELIAETYWRPS
jgi:hypothetical protein